MARHRAILSRGARQSGGGVGEQHAGALGLAYRAEPLEDGERGGELGLGASPVGGDEGLRKQEARPRLLPRRPDRAEAVGGPGEELGTRVGVTTRGGRTTFEPVAEQRERR